MADPVLVCEIERGGVEAIQAFRVRNPGITPDLSAAMFRGMNLRGAVFMDSNLDGADFTGADLTGANFVRASMRGLDLTKAVCDSANFAQSDLSSIKSIEGASFRAAQLAQAKLPQGSYKDTNWSEAQLPHVDLSGYDLSNVNFSKSNLQQAKLQRTRLRNANLSYVNFGLSDLEGADFTGADCTLSNFSSANLKQTCLKNMNADHATFSQADMGGADIEGANFGEAVFDRTLMRELKNVTRAKNLLTATIHDHELYFDTAEVSRFNRWLDWEKVRIAGRLPLFGASYSVLISIPLFFYLLQLYNDKVYLLRTWAEQELTNSAVANKSWADTLLRHLHPLQIPELSILLLVSTLLLAIGSTIYALACPSRIKEFSRDQWTYQLGRSVVHYLPAAWSRPWLRGAALIFYLFGGAGALCVLLSKLWNVFWFIVGSR